MKCVSFRITQSSELLTSAKLHRSTTSAKPKSSITSTYTTSKSAHPSVSRFTKTYALVSRTIAKLTTSSPMSSHGHQTTQNDNPSIISSATPDNSPQTHPAISQKRASPKHNETKSSNTSKFTILYYPCTEFNVHIKSILLINPPFLGIEEWDHVSQLVTKSTCMLGG